MMNRLCTLAELTCAFALGVSAPPASGQVREPKDMVGSFYAEPSLRMEPARSAAYLSRDLDAALKTAAPGFDYRYGDQAPDVSGLELLQEIDNEEAKVVAVFKSHGHPESVNWTLCLRSDGGWRIADADSNTGRAPWSLRAMLRLPADRIRC